tara:strand:+ start:445 stop:693 length:249 start_codon:yes stop_codon:yes gene_type:complete
MKLLDFELRDQTAYFTVKVGDTTYTSHAKTSEAYLFGNLIRRVEYVSDFYIGFRMILGECIGADAVLNDLRSEINKNLLFGF